MSRNLTFFDLASLFDSFALVDPRREQATYVSGEREGASFPFIQLCEGEDTMLLRMLVPGASLADLALEIEDNCLVVRGSLEAARGRYHRHERPVGRFRRVIRLPSPVSDGPLEAVLKDGVLGVTLPKAASARRRSIRVLHGEDSPKTLESATENSQEESHGR